MNKNDMSNNQFKFTKQQEQTIIKAFKCIIKMHKIKKPAQRPAKSKDKKYP